MDKQRRNFLKIASVTALAGIGAPALVRLSSTAAVASEHVAAAGHAPAKEKAGAHGEAVPKGVRLGMVIDMRRFVENPRLLNNAIAACNLVHNIPQIDNSKSEIKWLWKAPFTSVFPEQSAYHSAGNVENTSFAVLCNHCDDPPCVRACPTQATFKIPGNGIIAMDYHRCIGCRFCMAACPYGARSFNWEDPRPYIKKYNPDFPTRMRGVVEKCNFCGERLALGQEPACVEACKGTGAMVFGDLNDPKSEIRRLLDKEFTIQRNASLGTKPSVFYIV
jgi:molybdopterin-containing oxidoreductase family iron-sulfur binding subunit